ncbi:MAG: PAS domain S-box protein [Caldilineaceae bacterium]
MHLFSDLNDSPLLTKRSALRRYGLAFLLVTLATLLTMSVPIIRNDTPFAFLFVAVTLSTWYGGLRPGAFALCLAMIICAFGVLTPGVGLFGIDPDTAIKLGTFLFVSILLCLLVYALQRANERSALQRDTLRTTLASIGDAVIVTDLDARVSWLNEMAASLTGWPIREAVGRPLHDVLPMINEYTRTSVGNPVQRVLAEGKVVGLANHTLLLARDGVERPIEDSAAPIRDKAGHVSGVILVFRDVTERKQAEAETARLNLQIQQERERLAALVANVPGVVWEAWGQPDAQTQRIDFVSDYVETMLGYSKEAWLHTPNFWLSLVHPDDKAMAAQQAAANFSKGQQGVNRFRWLTKDGRVLYCEAVDTVIKDEHGQPIGMRGITFDRTELEQAEMTLRASERRFQQLADAMPQMVWASDPSGRLRYLNQQWLNYTRMTLEDSLASTTPAIHPDDLPGLQARWPLNLQTGEPLEHEMRLRRYDGEYRWFLTRIAPARDSNGAVTQWFGTSTDIDERKRAELNRQFLSELDAKIRRLSDPDEIRWTAVQSLGGYLGGARCTLNDVDQDNLQVTITQPWHQSRAPSLKGQYHLTDLISPALIDRLRQGEAVAIVNTATDAYSADRYATGYAPLGIAALITVPCLTEGRWVALLSLHSETPRQWRPEEIALVEAVATHVWPAIVKARAEQALRKSEEQLRLIADHMPGLIAYVDADERYGFVNATYEQWFGRSRAAIEASTVRELIGDPVYQARRHYLQAALAGQAVTFETTMTYPDGVTRTVMTTYVPHLETDQTVRGFYVFVTDISDRKQAEEALARYQLLSQRARDIILYVRHDGRIIEANEAALAAYGYDRATLLAKQIKELRDPTTVISVADQMQRADMQGIRFETQHRRQDGTTFPVEVSSIGADIDGERVLLSIIRDISDRKAAEAALRESEERFRATFEQAAVGVAQTNFEGRYLRVNQRLCEITGYNQTELLQKTFQEITHPADLAVDLAVSARVLSGELPSCRIEKRFIRQDGSWVWTTLTASVVRDEAGAIKYGIAIVEDISAQKEAEARLVFLAESGSVLASSLDYAVTLQHVADLMVPHLADWCAVDILRADGGLELAAVAHVDPAKVKWARELRARYPVDRQAPQGLPNVLRTGIAEFYPEITEDLIMRAEPEDDELAIIREVGFKSVIIAPLQARGQVLGGLTLVWADSDRRYTEADLRFAVEVAQRAAMAVDNARLYQEVRQLNETLEQRVVDRTAELNRSNQELDQFAYVASHDLKAPLRAIEHLAHWISEDAQALLPPPSQEHLVKLRGRVKRLDKLLDDLLAYSRAGRTQYHAETVDTRLLLENVIELLNPPPGFTMTIADEMPTIVTERIPLETLLRNLLNNAIKHHHEPSVGCVHIAAQVQGAWATFAVTDNGPGIDPAFHERIFQLFQTLRPRDQVEGSGIGLAVVKKTVESYGGAVEIESNVGQGTTIRFTWPVG